MLEGDCNALAVVDDVLEGYAANADGAGGRIGAVGVGAGVCFAQSIGEVAECVFDIRRGWRCVCGSRRIVDYVAFFYADLIISVVYAIDGDTSLYGYAIDGLFVGFEFNGEDFAGIESDIVREAAIAAVVLSAADS